MVYNIDDKIPFVQREEHKEHTIRQIIRYDSGYLKDLFLNNDHVVFSNECFAELCRLTKGHYDNWEPPKVNTGNIFDSCMTYKSPYLYDFNDEKLANINMERLKRGI